MLDKFKRKSATTAKPPVKAIPAAIDSQRQGTGLTAAQWITALVLKAGK